MEQKFNVGDKVIHKPTGKVTTITKVVKAAYYCYYTELDPEGYFIDTDLRKVCIYTGKKAKAACNLILDVNVDYPFSIPVNGYELESAGYWKEDGKYIAYDNTDYCCWMDEFNTLKEAKEWVESTHE